MEESKYFYHKTQISTSDKEAYVELELKKDAERKVTMLYRFLTVPLVNNQITERHIYPSYIERTIANTPTKGLLGMTKTGSTNISINNGDCIGNEESGKYGMSVFSIFEQDPLIRINMIRDNVPSFGKSDVAVGDLDDLGFISKCRNQYRTNIKPRKAVENTYHRNFWKDFGVEFSDVVKCFEVYDVYQKSS